jgi:hypothetical protein
VSLIATILVLSAAAVLATALSSTVTTPEGDELICTDTPPEILAPENVIGILYCPLYYLSKYYSQQKSTPKSA